MRQPLRQGPPPHAGRGDVSQVRLILRKSSEVQAVHYTGCIVLDGISDLRTRRRASSASGCLNSKQFLVWQTEHRVQVGRRLDRPVRGFHLDDLRTIAARYRVAVGPAMTQLIKTRIPDSGNGRSASVGAAVAFNNSILGLPIVFNEFSPVFDVEKRPARSCGDSRCSAGSLSGKLGMSLLCKIGDVLLAISGSIRHQCGSASQLTRSGFVANRGSSPHAGDPIASSQAVHW